MTLTMLQDLEATKRALADVTRERDEWKVKAEQREARDMLMRSLEDPVQRQEFIKAWGHEAAIEDMRKAEDERDAEKARSDALAEALEGLARVGNRIVLTVPEKQNPHHRELARAVGFGIATLASPPATVEPQKRCSYRNLTGQCVREYGHAGECSTTPTSTPRERALTEALRGLTLWISTWQHAISIRAEGILQAWDELERLHNEGCAALGPNPPRYWSREEVERMTVRMAERVKAACVEAIPLVEPIPVTITHQKDCGCSYCQRNHDANAPRERARGWVRALELDHIIDEETKP